MSPTTPRCHKRSLTYCRNRIGQDRYCVCGKAEGHSVFPIDEAVGHECAWCGDAYVKAQTTEGGA